MSLSAAQSKRPTQSSAVAPGADSGKVRLSVPELIHTVVTNIRNQFYTNQPSRNFKRDETALIKAVARFGYTCNNNDWQFTADEILKFIMDLLQQIKSKSADITYLPIYLQGTVDRHLGQKAEEYNALAKARRSPSFIVPNFEAKLADLEPAPLVSDVEVLAKVYTDLAAKRRAKTKKPAVKEKQTSLL